MTQILVYQAIFQGLNSKIANITCIDRTVSTKQGKDSIHSGDFPKILIQNKLKDSGTAYQANAIIKHL